MDPATFYSQKRQENNGVPVSFDLPSFLPLPPDALLDIEYTVNGAPSILSIQEKKKLLITDASATPQTISVQLTVTDNYSGLQSDFNFELDIYSCKP